MTPKSSFAVLLTPVTSAPYDFAICTANIPYAEPSQVPKTSSST
jgi:hypothetical protein